ncbi:cytochrome c oxidase subunit VI [Schizosaccharomyces cryophilus OY26]|uniref:Cytochrome c oxidase subunit 6, mitochondrial n=1 Tax=Schizosaccharomyces cryophilus (strain OY26 / ATCC MYA-4695 / CBS 11777 / NBRC 106824 / NRRL Y48691) TaxID=653667 RepID=S9X7W4_SCHCR|nr:cytochrome c oxidase subunit VI [Schizosaccharomyces cryophilus OY26]EPY53232.1 cytochrome c oxidase subunit VI [Schizosaccharomyces cryophilus OY26]
MKNFQRLIQSQGRFAASSAIARPSPLRFGSVGQFRFSSNHSASLEEINTKYNDFFTTVQDQFELQRGLNNCFAYDIVPSSDVIEQALRAARRVNDFPTAVRIFEGVKAKLPSKEQYVAYVKELKPVCEELGITLKEDLFH